MSRRFIIILTIVGLILVGAVAWALFSAKNTPSGDTSTKSGLGSFFPFGDLLGGNNTSDTTSGGDSTTGNIETPTVGPETGALKKISSKIVAGFGIHTPQKISGSDQTTPIPPVVRFAERGTGYLYETSISEDQTKKTTNQLVAKTWEAFFLNNGDSAVLRYLKDDNKTISSFLGTITTESPESGARFSGDFLPDGITDIAIAPDGKSLAYINTTPSGSTATSVKADGSSKKQLFSSPFSEWLIEWTASGLSATTKASADTPGYSYKVSASGFFQKTLGDTAGLGVKTSPDGKTLLFNKTESGLPVLYIENTVDGSVKNTGLKTFAEKCVWSSKSAQAYCGVPASLAREDYPDAWYQGVAHFSDDFWSIDTSTGDTTQLFSAAGYGIDTISPSIDPQGNYIVFINKNDRSVWSLQLHEIPKQDETFPETAVPKQNT